MPYIDMLDTNEWGTAALISKLLNASISQNNIKSFNMFELKKDIIVLEQNLILE